MSPATWSALARARRVVIKVEVSEQGVNTRFVVTDMEQARTQVLYQHLYCARGQAENEIKDQFVDEISINLIKYNTENNKVNEDIERIRLLSQNDKSGFYLKMDNEDLSIECDDDAQRVF